MKLKAPLDLHPIHSPVFDTMFVCLIDFECLLGDTLQLTTVSTYCFTPPTPLQSICHPPGPEVTCYIRGKALYLES